MLFLIGNLQLGLFGGLPRCQAGCVDIYFSLSVATFIHHSLFMIEYSILSASILEQSTTNQVPSEMVRRSKGSNQQPPTFLTFAI
jgi:hypothetical protein